MTELEELRIRTASLRASIDSLRKYIEIQDKEICRLRFENAAIYKKIDEVQRENDHLFHENMQFMKLLRGNKTQEPKTVLYSGDGYADGYMVYDMAECPNCGYEYEVGDKDWGENFCPHCGQPLKWESEE